MPIITFDVGKLSKEQKAELVSEFTETAHRVTGISKEAIVTVIREHDLDNIGSGGQLLAEKLKQVKLD